MRETEVSGSAVTDSEVGGRPRASSATPAWLDYLRPLRFDHWIKNLVVPVGSLLALAAQGSLPDGAALGAILLAFVVSGLVSSVNYAVNEVLDAPFDARHPTKRDRPIPSGRVRVAPLLWLAAGVALLAFGLSWWLLPPAVLLAARGPCSPRGSCTTCRLSGSRTGRTSTRSPSPSRIPFGSRLAGTPSASGAPPILLLVTVWAFGAFLMTGKRLAELRLLGDLAARYRPTFRAYSITGLCVVQLSYALVGFAALARLVMMQRPEVLPALPLVARLLAWAFKMTFEPESPLIDPEHLYRRPVFLLVSIATFALLVELALR